MSLRSRAVDAVFAALEGMAALYDLVRRLRRAAPIPLVRRRVTTIRPPPP